jgi:hypothetical protein
MRTFRFVTDQAVEDGCADLLPLAEAVITSRFTVLQRLNSTGMSATQLRDNCLQARASHSTLMGDTTPVLWGNVSPDGHPQRNLHCCKLFATDGAITVDANNVVQTWPQTPPWGAVSRVWFAAQPGDPRSSVQLYRDWLQKIISPPGTDYRAGVSIDDQLAGPGYSEIGDAAVARIPPALIRDHFRDLPVNVPDLASPNSLYQLTDGVWVGTWDHDPTDIDSAIAPGQEFPQLVGLWYEGQTLNLRADKPRSRIAMIFGSFQIDYTWPDNLLLAWITLPDTISSVYNFWGLFPISVYLAGGTLGDAQIAMALQPEMSIYRGMAITYLLDVVGDITQIMTEELSDVAGLLIRVQAIEDWKASLGNVVVSNPPPPPPPPLTGKINIGGPTVTDPAGDWAAATGSVGAALAQRVQAIDMSACAGVPLAVLQTGWYSGSPVTYTIGGLVPGSRTLRLFFAETFSPARTQRVTIGGQIVLDNFNIAAAAGAVNKAVSKDISVTVGADGNLSFTLSVVTGDPNSWISGAAVI